MAEENKDSWFQEFIKYLEDWFKNLGLLKKQEEENLLNATVAAHNEKQNKGHEKDNTPELALNAHETGSRGSEKMPEMHETVGISHPTGKGSNANEGQPHDDKVFVSGRGFVNPNPEAVVTQSGKVVSTNQDIPDKTIIVKDPANKEEYLVKNSKTGEVRKPTEEEKKYIKDNELSIGQKFDTLKKDDNVVEKTPKKSFLNIKGMIKDGIEKMHGDREKRSFLGVKTNKAPQSQMSVDTHQTGGKIAEVNESKAAPYIASLKDKTHGYVLYDPETNKYRSPTKEEEKIIKEQKLTIGSSVKVPEKPKVEMGHVEHLKFNNQQTAATVKASDLAFDKRVDKAVENNKLKASKQEGVAYSEVKSNVSKKCNITANTQALEGAVIKAIDKGRLPLTPSRDTISSEHQTNSTPQIVNITENAGAARPFGAPRKTKETPLQTHHGEEISLIHQTGGHVQDLTSGEQKKDITERVTESGVKYKVTKDGIDPSGNAISGDIYSFVPNIYCVEDSHYFACGSKKYPTQSIASNKTRVEVQDILVHQEIYNDIKKRQSISDVEKDFMSQHEKRLKDYTLEMTSDGKLKQLNPRSDITMSVKNDKDLAKQVDKDIKITAKKQEKAKNTQTVVEPMLIFNGQVPNANRNVQDLGQKDTKAWMRVGDICGKKVSYSDKSIYVLDDKGNGHCAKVNDNGKLDYFSISKVNGKQMRKSVSEVDLSAIKNVNMTAIALCPDLPIGKAAIESGNPIGINKVKNKEGGIDMVVSAEPHKSTIREEAKSSLENKQASFAKQQEAKSMTNNIALNKAHGNEGM